MATEWGRKETIFWPPHLPIWTYGAVLLTLVCTVLFGVMGWSVVFKSDVAG